MSSILFEDTFEVKEIDPDGKKFDRVSRFICYGESYEMDLHIDIATHIYPLEHEKFKFVLASSLSLDGTMDISFDSNKPSLADKFDYVMFGKIFKYQKDNSSSKVSIYASFGGLLMLLQGDPRYLTGLELDARIYLLIKKI